MKEVASAAIGKRFGGTLKKLFFLIYRDAIEEIPIKATIVLNSQYSAPVRPLALAAIRPIVSPASILGFAKAATEPNAIPARSPIAADDLRQPDRRLDRAMDRAIPIADDRG